MRISLNYSIKHWQLNSVSLMRFSILTGKTSKAISVKPRIVLPVQTRAFYCNKLSDKPFVAGKCSPKLIA